MYQNIGEFHCKVDSKGRIRLPTGLLRKYDEGMEFVINRGLEKCLNLYPRPVWNNIAAKVNKLNSYNKKIRAFIRYIHSGASDAKPDGSDRILLSKIQMEHAGIDKEVILVAVNNYIEIWDKETYIAELAKASEELENMSDIANDVSNNIDFSGGIDNNNSDNKEA
ncbi:MAG: division/cell wall cluster transcriptional repressor MraZ [Saprospiraceae bacterium]